LVAVGCLLGGALTGLAAVLLHGYWWGLVLGLAATAAALVALPGGWWRRLPYGVGYAGQVALLAPERPEGDYLISADAEGYLLLASAVAVLVAAMVGVRDHGVSAAGSTGENSGVDARET